MAGGFIWNTGHRWFTIESQHSLGWLMSERGVGLATVLFIGAYKGYYKKWSRNANRLESVPSCEFTARTPPGKMPGLSQRHLGAYTCMYLASWKRYIFLLIHGISSALEKPGDLELHKSLLFSLLQTNHVAYWYAISVRWLSHTSTTCFT